MRNYNVFKPLLAVIILVAIVTPVFWTQRAEAVTAQPSSVSIGDTAVYNSLISDNDTLIVGTYNVVYGTTPSDTIDKTFIFKLLDGSALIGSVTAYPYYNYGYGLGVFSFYFPADNGVTWGQPYTIAVSENPAAFVSPISYSFNLETSDYSPYTSNQTANRQLLQTKITIIAQQLTIAWGMVSTPLTEQSGSGIILSSYGESYFRNAIYGIQMMCPSLFLLQNTNLDYTPRSWDYSFALALQNTFLGTWVYDDFLAGFAGIWNVPTETATSFISFIVALVVFCISVGISKDSPQSTQGAFLDGVTVLIFATLSGFFSPVINALLAFCFVLVGAWILLLNRA